MVRIDQQSAHGHVNVFEHYSVEQALNGLWDSMAG